MGNHLKYSAVSNHLLKNASNHLINECDPCEHCDTSTQKTIYRATIPADTFTSGDATCRAAFNSTTKDLTVGHPFYAAACVRALDIMPLGEDGEACDDLSPDAIVMTFLSASVLLDFIFGAGFIRFSLTGLTAPYDCSAGITVTYDSTSGSPPIDSTAGKTIDIAFVS